MTEILCPYDARQKGGAEILCKKKRRKSYDVFFFNKGVTNFKFYLLLKFVRSKPLTITEFSFFFFRQELYISSCFSWFCCFSYFFDLATDIAIIYTYIDREQYRFASCAISTILVTNLLLSLIFCCYLNLKLILILTYIHKTSKSFFSLF